MRPIDIAKTVIAVGIWGSGYVVSRKGVQDVPTFLFTALRYLVVLPLVFFVPFPRKDWGVIISIGFLWGVCQVGLTNLGLTVGASAGLTGLVMQTSVFFSSIFAWFFLKEDLTCKDLLCMAIGFLGIYLPIMHANKESTLIGFFMILLASIFWALGNILLKRGAQQNIFSLTVWMSAVAFPPLAGLSLYLEGWDVITHSVQNLNQSSIICILYSAIVSGIVARVLWAQVLSRNSANQITQYNFLEPIFSILLAAIILGEPFTLELGAGLALVLISLIMHYRFKLAQGNA